jgi:hypothetical protein
MIPANDNQILNAEEIEKRNHLALVRVGVPKDKALEIMTFAIGLLRKRLEEKKVLKAESLWISYLRRLRPLVRKSRTSP